LALGGSVKANLKIVQGYLFEKNKNNFHLKVILALNVFLSKRKAASRKTVAH
jgi:hypothetical protein